MKQYKYELAFSLCKQDIEFAKELASKLNTDLHDKIFLYTDKQEVLISKIGPEEFRDVFINQSRIVVILYRNEYGSTFYTQLEKDAIIERLSKENEGYNFIFMIPMVQGAVPPWYPTTRIYADPFNFSIEDLAKFIEFKIIEREGVIKPIKFIDRINDFKNGLTVKNKRIQNLLSPESLTPITKELDKIKHLFEEHYNYVMKTAMPFPVAYNNNMTTLFIGLNNYILELYIEDNEKFGIHNLSSQSFKLRMSIFSEDKYRFRNISTSKPFLQQCIYRFNQEKEDICGWSEEIRYGKLVEPSLLPYVFESRSEGYFYDLQKFHSSDTIIDTWYSLFFDYVKKRFETV